MSKYSFQQIIESLGAAVAMGFTVILGPILRGWTSQWGATNAEATATLPGDDHAPHPTLAYTRAITIHAPPQAIWPWLVQFGQERAGFYSYEPLENLIGCKVNGATAIVADYQHLAIGDTMRLGPKGYPLFKLVQIEPNRALVYAAADPKTETISTYSEPLPDNYVINSWAFILQPLDEQRTRLIVRGRNQYPPSSGNQLLWKYLVDPIAFVMERKTLLTLKQLAEATPRREATTQTVISATKS